MPGPHPAPLSPTVTVPDAASRFAALHEDFLVLPNPWDVGTARLLAGLGFSALASSSAACAWGLGRPDGTITREVAVAHAAALGEASGLPVNGDFESGYGVTPDEVATTVEAAIEAGVAGCSIEDLATDRPEPLYEPSAACRRLEAAREAIERAGSDFVLTGRCEALQPYGKDGLSEALSRIPQYVAAGAMVIYVPYLTGEDEVRAVVEASSVPVSVIAGLGGVSEDLAALRALGVRRVTLGSGLAKVALRAFLDAAEALRDGRVALDGAASSRRLNEAFART
ncbi:isocitrate lyase/PEP mutase family protein [Acuticoccus sp.]|uniref:isocitrate lyase/PEP mutase family protein n=1 Tax=Acuticoccus sp. TaxID=1904378 RepID=UPI003B52A10A